MKIFEVAGVGKLHGLTVMSLDAFVKDDEKEVEEAVEGRQKHKVAVTVSDPNHTAVSQRGETRQRMCSVTADGREQACDTAVKWYKKQGYQVHDHNYVGTVEDTVKEGVMSDLHLQFADVYDELAPGIEKHRDSFKAGQLYDALEAVAEKNGAVSEFKRMMMSARNSAHQDYDTNPGGFENWFWYLPFGDLNESQIDEIDRRGFLKGLGAAAVAGAAGGGVGYEIGKKEKTSKLQMPSNTQAYFLLGYVYNMISGLMLNSNTEMSKWSNEMFDLHSQAKVEVASSDNDNLEMSYHKGTKTARDSINEIKGLNNYPIDPTGKAAGLTQDQAWEYDRKFRNDKEIARRIENKTRPYYDKLMKMVRQNESVNQGVAEGSEKYKVKSIGTDSKGDYYISPSTGEKVYKSGVKRGDHENPNTGEIKKNIAEAPGDFGLGANYRAVPDAEMQDLMGRSKNKTKTKRDKFDYPYIHGSNIQVKDEGGKTFDAEALKKSIMVRPGRILGQNAKMQHSETGTEAIFDIGLPALKGLAVNEKTGEFVVVDTCPGAGACKTFCYAMKGSYVMFKAVSMGLARMLNFLLNDPQGFASQLNAEIAAAKSKMAKKNAKVVVRWHDAGDFFSAEYLDMAYGVATANPDVGFYAYTKMADVATGQRPKNFNMNFSGGALSSQEKKIDFQRVKHSKVVPKDMFFDLIARDGNNLKKDAKGRMQFASAENLDQFKSIMAQKYAIDKNSILTYDEMMKTPVGDKPKWNTIVMPGDGDNSANRNDVIGSYLLFH
jgi:hypothetical protein